MTARKAPARRRVACRIPHLFLCFFAVLFIWAGMAAAQAEPAAAGAAGDTAAEGDYDALTQIWSTFFFFKQKTAYEVSW